MATTHCPTCRALVEWGPQSPYRPFCSKRCRLIDLGAWLDGSHHIPGNELEGDDFARLDAGTRPANDDSEGY